jgi:hypothetical protein
MRTLTTCRVALIIAAVLSAAGSSLAASVDDNNRFPETVSPGQQITVSGKFDSTDPKDNVTAKLHPLGGEPARDPKDQNVTSPNKVTITLPDDLLPGRYYMTISYADLKDKLVPGELRVQAKAVQLDAAHPTTAYRNANGGFDFDVIGQNFNASVPRDNQIYVSGQGPIIQGWLPGEQPCKEPCLSVESSGKLHVIGYKADRYQGPISFKVQVGSAQSEEKRLTLSRMSETGVLIWSVAIFFALAYIVYRLVTRGIRGNVIDGKRYSPFWSFFLDKQTNTYSLSKFQLFSFFSVFVFGYLYVFLCRWLVQWQFILPDVPGSFTAILAMSSGTTLAAAGATATRGSKGAGPVVPSAADFITTGGQVVPERFQFFVWTLVACLGFLALLISQDPATIEGFPKFPDGLLYVMGVSAGGYLGGKLARAAGPVIHNIALGDKGVPASPPDQAKKVIIVQGENLSKTGDFYVDGKKLEIQPEVRENLVEATPQDQQGSDLCSQLKITIVGEALDLSSGDHDFRIMNKDGQFADARFTADPPRIDSVQDPTPLAPGAAPDPNKVIAQGTSERTIVVKGSGFRSAVSAAKWKPANAQEPSDLTPDAVRFVDSGTLEITLAPGAPGSGTLTLVMPNGFSATATVTIV